MTVYRAVNRLPPLRDSRYWPLELQIGLTCPKGQQYPRISRRGTLEKSFVLRVMSEASAISAEVAISRSIVETRPAPRSGLRGGIRKPPESAHPHSQC